MRFLTVRELRSGSAKLWEQMAKDGEIVITSNGKPVALLSPVTERMLEREIAALHRARAEVALDDLHRASVAKGIHRLTDDEIKNEIQAVRRQRKTP